MIYISRNTTGNYLKVDSKEDDLNGNFVDDLDEYVGGNLDSRRE